MLRIEVYIGRRRIASAEACNVTAGDMTLSNYSVIADEEGSELTGLSKNGASFMIRRHKRQQSAWALVAKIARRMAQSGANQ